MVASDLAQKAHVPVRVVIVGGGTAGWMTAAGLVGLLSPRISCVRLIESDEIATVGVGEATLPQIRTFNRAVGLSEYELMRRTGASFKLGIEFRGWGFPGSSYIHPFGAFGRPLGGVEFQHQWLRAVRNGHNMPIEEFSLAVAAARRSRFDFPSDDASRLDSTFDYAYHLDASLYAEYLRGFCQRGGVTRTEGKVVDVRQDAATGTITGVTLASGEQVDGDLFVDCSGFRALLIGKTLKSGWEDWSQWLLCDRALAVPSARTEDFHPYTRVTARAAGWQWRIPLQHRTGNGYVFSSQFIEPDKAAETLLANLDGAALDTPRLLQFSAGRRVRCWEENCIAVGLSSGFLEPLESTSIYLIQRAVEALVSLFPGRVMDPALRSEFNRRMDVEYERIRDFLILHYHLNRLEEEDSGLWRHCREMSVPDSLTHKIALFAHSGRIERYRDGLFSPPSWLSVLLGQGITPAAIHPLADAMPLMETIGALDEIRTSIADRAEAMPSHAMSLDGFER